MKLFYLLDVPYSGADLFLHHCQVQSDGLLVRFRDNLTPSVESSINSTAGVTTVSPSLVSTLGCSLPLDRVGLMLCEPAHRLAMAYVESRAYAKTEESFEEYYRHPTRLNLFSAITAHYPVEELGFIGIREYFNKSLSLVTNWLSMPHKFSHHRGVDQPRSKADDLLTPEHYKEIKQLHQQDYVLYERAKKLVNSKTETPQIVQTDIKEKLANKQIYIHVGPPKTGTSAIQAWLLANKDELAKNGIYYPAHQTDENGISSGNFLSVLSRDERNKKYSIDKQKLTILLREFAQMDCAVLLLSSEHFHNHLIDLMGLLPTANYIYYIRNPLATIESSYHQQVKRHGKAESFSLPKAMNYNHLHAFLTVAHEFSVRPVLRFYDRELTRGNSLVEDFLSIFHVAELAPKQDKKVNTRYGLGELELMRLCNNFISPYSATKLDRWLQKNSTSQAAFTFIPKDYATQAKEQLVQHIAILREQFVDMTLASDFFSRLETLATLGLDLPVKQQSEAGAEIHATWQQLKLNNPLLAKKIAREFRRWQALHPQEAGCLPYKFTWTLSDQLRWARKFIGL